MLFRSKVAVFDRYNEVQFLSSQGKEDEALEIINAMTDEEYKAYESLKTSLRNTPADAKNIDSYSAVNFSNKTEGDFLSGIALYARAIGTDPFTAFNRIFTGQKIRKLENGTIIVERMPVSESQAVKEDRGGKSGDFKLDHIIPLQLGGSNSGNNLLLVPTEVWASFTNYENELGRQLRNGDITKKEAQAKIKEFKKDYID